MKINSKIGLGTAAIGRPLYINIKQGAPTPFLRKEFKQQGLEMLDHAYSLGIRYFDTAPGYGLAEELMIEWLQKRQDPTIEVATKWGYTYVANFKPDAKVHEIKEHSLAKLNEQWEVSKQLFPFLKNYQIHSATLDTGVLDDTFILEQLFQIKKENKIRIGITTTGNNQSEVLKKALDIHYNGEQLFEVFQCTYNILDQSIYETGLKIIKDNKQLIIKEALANGRLFPNKAYPAYTSLYEKLISLSEKYGAGIDALTLRYCQTKLDGAIVLSGANTIEHLEQNMNVNNFELNDQEIAELSHFKTHPKAYWEERKKLTWN